MWEHLLDRLFATTIRRGSLTLTLHDGRPRSYGPGGEPSVAVRVSDQNFAAKLVRNPDLAVGEAYMDGTLEIEGDDLYGFLTLAIINVRGDGFGVWWMRWLLGLRARLQPLLRANTIGRARSNVAHHYDLSGALYDLFLDEDRQYSCAYFTDPEMSLEDAQLAKKRLIARKLLIEPDCHVLDIGCGWGGMALTLAKEFGARVTGVTLSREQHRIATERVRAAGLSDRIDIRLQDYRHVPETFDRIVSVGMFEHVGKKHFSTYFNAVHDRLKPDSVALIHTIGRTSPPGPVSPWIDKYIFPGGYIPSLSEMSRAVEDARLYTTDVEVWRLHYAETLKAWHDRFMARAEKAEALYDARFVSMWRYYLIASELTFRLDHQCVFQVQLAHDQAAVPLTRDYLYAQERTDLRHAAE